MNAFDQAGASAPRPLPQLLPQVGALLAAGAVALFACRLPLLHTVSWGELIGSAVECVLEVVLASAVTVWGICAISSRSLALDTRRLIVRSSLAALWIAPLALLLRENSPWAIAIAAVLVASVVKSIRLPQDSGPADFQESQFQESPPQESLVLGPNGNPFSLLESAPSFRSQAFGGSAALCAEAGIGAAFAGYPFMAVALVAAASAVWTWSYTRIALPAGAQPYSSSGSSLRPLTIIALAIVITAAALVPYLPFSFGMRGFGVPSRTHSRRGFPQGEPGGQRSREKTFDTSTGLTTEGDAGIVLSPDKLTRTKLVAPTPIIANAPLTGHGSATPLVIPFDGVYWFFKAPDLHPPQHSRQAHGSPELLNIHSTDRRPLSMEAHDNLGSLIDLNCCDRIQIAIRNADPYSETVSLELILINSSLPRQPSQSLGRVVVKSKRKWNVDEEQTYTQETLNFAIPPNPTIRRFDEVRIVFRLDAFRADDGAKIAIDHLVLVPRGL
jgi:hypothetical protein